RVARGQHGSMAAVRRKEGGAGIWRHSTRLREARDGFIDGPPLGGLSALSRIKTGDWAWPFRGPRVGRGSPSRHLMHCRVCFTWWPKGPFSPLTSALRHDHRNACPSQRLPAAGRFQFAPSATCRIQLRHYALKSQRISQRRSSDAHAAPNLDQIEKIDDTFDAVGLVSICSSRSTNTWRWRYGSP